MSNTPEYILCAAIHFDDGKKHAHQPNGIETGLVFCGHRHCSIFAQIGGSVGERQKLGIYQRGSGFLTNTGRYVERQEAARIAIEANQVEEADLRNPLIGLFSEDLY